MQLMAWGTWLLGADGKCYTFQFTSDHACWGHHNVNSVQSSVRQSADEEYFAALRLAFVPGVGPRMHKELISAFGSPAAVLSAPPSDLLGVPGVGPKLMRRIVNSRQNIDVEREIAVCESNSISILVESEAEYPRLLREIPDPPGVLFVLGELLPVDAMAIAIVGTRHATQYGKKQAHRLASGLARAGMTIVSGMARGVDAAAHRGALEAGGRTIAVTASGVLNIYPPEHKELAYEISSNGALVSENCAHAPPKSAMFPQRNRIITGLSLGVIVVEAADRSGALISAWHAMDQNREVFAVPGRIDSRASRGCHAILREGAKLVESPDDVLEELGPLIEAAPTRDGREIHRPAELQLSEQQQHILDAVQPDPTLIEQVVVQSGLPIQRVLSTISVLETKHLIRRVSGNSVVRM